MKNKLHISALAIALSVVPAALLAQDKPAATPTPTERWSGGLTLGAETYLNGGRKDSAKFQEYRDVPYGLFGGGADINYENNIGYHADFSASNIAQHDEEGTLGAGSYNEWDFRIDHNRTPHRFAFGAVSLFDPVGNEDLQVSDALQSELQSATSTVQQAGILNSAIPTATEFDERFQRNDDSARLDITNWDPINITVEVKRDTQKGTRPFAGSFGFGNALELIEPRDYQTMQYKAGGEYASKDYFFSAAYYASVFDNTKGALSWDNPFRLTDSTSPTAYLDPTGAGASFANDGGSRGLIDLAPDNHFQNVSLNGALRDLPLESTLTAALSFGWMRQDADLYPYTTNTAINQASGAPFNASTLAGLPVRTADQSVDTTLFNVAWTADPVEGADSKVYYRYYQRDNESGRIMFPGYVRFDATWVDQMITTQPVGYDRHTTGADLGYQVYDNTRAGAAYRFDRMNRDFREVDSTDDNSFELSLDNKSSDLVTVRTAWNHSIRDISGGYNFAEPFDGLEVTQMPTLRKYDQADRIRDTVDFIVSVFPMENLDVSGSFLMGVSDYDESQFGLLKDDEFVYSLDATYQLSNRSNVFGFYSWEQHHAKQRDRQWNQGGVGDPFLTEPGFNSLSNWSAKVTDTVNTFGAGFEFDIVPKVVAFKAAYTLSYADGEADFASQVGTPLSDTNPFDPKTYNQEDDIVWQTISPRVVWTIQKDLNVTFGYLWERYHVNDFSKTGFTYVPTTTSGSYNGAVLMETMPWINYEVNLLFAKVDYRF